jgi:hypothetical protein
MVTRSPAQRLVDAAEVALPDARPPCVDAHTWGVLVRHVRDGVPYAALAGETGVSGRAISYRVERLLARLRTPDLLCWPPPLWRAPVTADYTDRAAIATASDEQLLAVPGLDAGALWRLRHGFYAAPRPRTEKVRAYRAGQLARQVRPAPRRRSAGSCHRSGSSLPMTMGRGSSATSAAGSSPAWPCTRAIATG